MRPEQLNELVVGIDAALIQIGLGQNAKDAAVTIRAHLIDLLALLNRNSGLDAAADDLQKSVHTVVEAGERSGADDRQLRLLTEAHVRFRDRLAAVGG